MQTHLSEVARIREQIELECRAFAHMFEEPAIVASHRSELQQVRYNAREIAKKRVLFTRQPVSGQT